MKKQLLIILLLFVLFAGFRNAGNIFFLELPNWPQPAYNFEANPLSADKINLGRALFYEPSLSLNNKISCASCHSSYNAFAHVDHRLSHGINDRIGTRNAPALMNLAWQTSFMWDGAINHLDMQSLFPITHPDEMGETIQNVVLKLQQSKVYPEMFQIAFGDSTITGERILKAISQFMLTIVSADSKYDRMVQNREVFTEQEARGYTLFKQNCASCHAEPLFSNFQFENNGLPVDTSLNDFGKMKITKSSNDSIKFKVPTLRNLEFTFPYMHDGRFDNLSEVINHYTKGIQKSKTLSVKLKNPIQLSSNEKVDLIAFLLTLTDKDFLFDERFSYPKYMLTHKTQQP
jgi:cytochrome c peroxidase